MDPNQFRGIGPLAEDGHAEMARAIEGEPRRAITWRNWLESAMALGGVVMGTVVAGAVVLALLRVVF